MYFGWAIVGIAGLVYMLMMGATYGALGLFVIPVSEEFELSRANMNTALILLNLGSAAFSPIIGRLLDRYSARLIMVVSAILFGGSLIGLGLSQSVGLSALILGIPMAIALPGTGTLTMSVLLARWFTVQRGRAMVLAAMGMSLGSVVVTPIVGWLMELQGWRATLLFMGASIAILLLILSTFVRERPGPGDVEIRRAAAPAPEPAPAHAAAPGAPLPVMAVLRMPKFWTIGISSAIAMAMTQAIAITVVPLGIDHGLSLMEATSLMSITGGAAITGKILLSTVADRIERFTLLTAFFTLGAVLNVCLLFSHGYVMLAGCAVILGVASGAMAPIFYALLADQFGIATFGTVRGLMSPLLALCGAFVVRFTGEVYDRTGDYDLLFAVFVIAQILAAILMFSTRYWRGAPMAAAGTA